MRDITAITQVGVAASGVYDLNGFESVMAILTVTTGFDASGITVSAGDTTTVAAIPANDPAVVIRFEGADGKTAKVGYIGGARYVKFAGGTVVAVILQNPGAAPLEVKGEPADATRQAARSATSKLASAETPTE